MYTQTLVEFMPRGGAISVPVLVLAGSCKPILSRILEVGVLGRQDSSSDPDGAVAGLSFLVPFDLKIFSSSNVVVMNLWPSSSTSDTKRCRSGDVAGFCLEAISGCNGRSWGLNGRRWIRVVGTAMLTIGSSIPSSSL